MKIIDILVGGYKSLKNFRMEDLENLVTLIGENSCGKTNSLDHL